MKRSKMLKLVLMGAAGTLAAGCGDGDDDGYDISEDVTVYKSVQDCVDKAVFTETFCKENFDKAKELNEKVAPRFAAQSACEAQFGPGGCESRASDSGGSVWLPAIAGFMLGQALGSRRTEVIYQPLYNSYSSGGGGGGYGGGSYGGYRTWNNPTPIRPNASGSARFDTNVLRDAASVQKPAFSRTTTVARGGFGARASSSSSSSFGG